jgi:pimeloyl-ACP methyl ester carboxylesterase
VCYHAGVKGSARRWVILGAIAVVLVGLWPLARDAALALALMRHLARPLQPGPLTRWTAAPPREDLTVPYPAKGLAATLFRPGGAARSAGVVLIHGVNETGKDDPRIIWVADLLARAGFMVLVPDFTGFKSLTLRASDIDEIVASARFLDARLPGRRPDKVGLVAFSYGAGPAVAAAAEPAARDRLRFVVSFGGYYDLANVITFVTTGRYEYRGERGQLAPNPYNRWIFLKYNLDLLGDPADRALLVEIARHKAERPPVEAAPLAAKLTPEGKALYALMANRDPARVPALLRQVHPDVAAQIARLSPARVVRDVRAHLFIAHSNPDEFIPFTESLRLAEAAPDPARVHLVLLGGFRHVRPEFPPLTWSSLWNFYLAEGRRMFWFVFRLLRVGA